MRTLLLLLMLLALPAAGIAQVSSASFVLSAAAVEADGSSLHLSGTLGQPFSRSANTASFTVEEGFWFAVYATTTDVERDEAAEIPSEVRLEQNYPNPFNPATTIPYALPQASRVRLTVYDVLGRAVAVLVDDVQGPGVYRVTFEAGDLPSGTYFYRLETDQGRRLAALSLVK